MSYDPYIHHRRSIRLPGYDYTQPGSYFITIVTFHRAPIFGEITDGGMQMNDLGMVAETCWRSIPDHFPNAELDDCIAMPNHIHGIITMMENGNGFIPNTTPDTYTDGTVGARQCRALTAKHTSRAKPGSIGVIIHAKKSAVTAPMGV